jgi:hypothetical protein
MKVADNQADLENVLSDTAGADEAMHCARAKSRTWRNGTAAVKWLDDAVRESPANVATAYNGWILGSTEECMHTPTDVSRKPNVAVTEWLHCILILRRIGRRSLSSYRLIDWECDDDNGGIDEDNH